MKSRLLTISAAVCLAACAAPSLHAQNVMPNPRAVIGFAPKDPDQDSTGQFSTQSLEDLRTQLIGLTDTVHEFGALAPDLIDLNSLDQAKAYFQQMSYAQLNILRRGVNPSKVASRLQHARAVISAYTRMKAYGGSANLKLRPSYNRKTPQSALPPGQFPTVSGFCSNNSGDDGPSRIPVTVILAADVTWFEADVLRETSQDECKQDAVAFGEGGNTSTACTPVDTVWVAAKAVDEGIHFCDDDLTGNEVDAIYQGLDDVYNGVSDLSTQLTNTQAELDSRIAQLTTLVGNLSAQLVQSTQDVLRFTNATAAVVPAITTARCAENWRPIISLSSAAPPGGLLLNLTSSNPLVTVPSSLVMPAGSTNMLLSVSCAAAASALPVSATITISASPFVPPTTANVVFN